MSSTVGFLNFFIMWWLCVGMRLYGVGRVVEGRSFSAAVQVVET